MLGDLTAEHILLQRLQLLRAAPRLQAHHALNSRLCASLQQQTSEVSGSTADTVQMLASC